MTSEKKQLEKYKEAAQELSCDPSEYAFEKRLRQVASSSSRKKDGSDGREKPDRKKGKEWRRNHRLQNLLHCDRPALDESRRTRVALTGQQSRAGSIGFGIRAGGAATSPALFESHL